MIKKMILLIITLLMVTINTTYGHKSEMKNMYNVIESQDLTALEELIKEADENTLVIFDVKSVLIVERDALLQSAHKMRFKELKSKMNNNISKEKAEELHSIILSQRKFELVEKKLPKIFANMRAKNVKFIALTSGRTGKFGIIEKREDLRIKILKGLGIDFSTSYPNIETIIFPQVTINDKIELPMFKEGILFASKTNKGNVLKEFYQQEKIKVNKIIFVDNLIKNLNSVGEFCKEANISYVGIHYTNILNRKASYLDEKIANYQLEILIKQNKWLSDREARQAIYGSKFK